MTFTKRTLSLFLVPAMLFGLAACSKAPSPQPAEATTAATEPQTTVSPTDSLFESMTLEEKVGQLFYMCYPDDSFAETIKNYHLGGLVLFGAHFEDKTADQIRQQIKAYQQSAEKVGLLIGVDEEGGDVVRVSSNPNVRSEAFWSPKVTYQDGGWDAVTAAETEKADLLLSLGVNVNNAPVCDVTSNEESFIYSRSFSGDVNDVCTYVTKTVDICREKKLGTVLKHFPGYGDNTDTHEDMAYDEKPYEDFQQVDFLPFKAGIKAGADAVMVAHNIVTGMDANVPASLSAKVHQILRDELHFDGVIMTDDLSMQAITQYTGSDAAAVAAVKCGNDLLCCTDVAAQYPAVLAAVKNGEIPEEQINASVRRILRWKEHLGLIK